MLSDCRDLVTEKGVKTLQQAASTGVYTVLATLPTFGESRSREGKQWVLCTSPLHEERQRTTAELPFRSYALAL